MRVWAVARLAVSEGIRMKLALVFLFLIGLIVVGLPFSIKGDSSVTGAVQSFMSYAFSATGVLLGFLTIFLSRSLSDELANRQIFLVMTKPIPRWQFLLGKWLGMVLLIGTFLFAAGGTVYGMVHYIQRTHPPIDPRFDAAELANEVLVARHAIAARAPDFRDDAELEFERNLEEGAYANLPDFSKEKEIQRLTSKHDARWRIVPPLDSRVFEFENVLADRRRDQYLQLRYKTDVTRYAPDEILRAVWRFGDPYKGTKIYEYQARHIVGRYQTIRIPAGVIAEDNTVMATFLNQNPFQGEPQYANIMEFRKSEPVELLFVVGSFEGNLLRLLVLMQCKLMFLAAVSLLAATVFSFPVACLTSLTVYVLAGARSFIVESLTFTSATGAGMFDSLKEFCIQGFMGLYDLISWLIPNFGRYDAVESFVNGRNVGLVWVLQGISDLVLLKTLLLLGLAMLLFQRREVAELSY